MKDPYLTPNGIPLCERRQVSEVQVNPDNTIFINCYLQDNGVYYLERTVKVAQSIPDIGDVTVYKFSYATDIPYGSIWTNDAWFDMNTGNIIDEV